MASCAICKKMKTVGNHVSHANNRTKRKIMPNLQRVRIVTKKGIKRLYVCTRCLRSGMVKKAV